MGGNMFLGTKKGYNWGGGVESWGVELTDVCVCVCVCGGGGVY